MPFLVHEGVDLDRSYRRAAMVIWPESKTLDVIASAGIRAAVDWVAGQFGVAPRERIEELSARLIGIWRHDPRPSVRGHDGTPGSNDGVRLGQRDERPRASIARAGSVAPSSWHLDFIPNPRRQTSSATEFRLMSVCGIRLSVRPR